MKWIEPCLVIPWTASHSPPPPPRAPWAGMLSGLSQPFFAPQFSGLPQPGPPGPRGSFRSPAIPPGPGAMALVPLGPEFPWWRGIHGVPWRGFRGDGGAGPTEQQSASTKWHAKDAEMAGALRRAWRSGWGFQSVEGGGQLPSGDGQACMGGRGVVVGDPPSKGEGWGRNFSLRPLLFEKWKK